MQLVLNGSVSLDTLVNYSCFANSLNWLGCPGYGLVARLGSFALATCSSHTIQTRALCKHLSLWAMGHGLVNVSSSHFPCIGHTIQNVPLLSSDQRSQTGLGLTSTRLNDRPGTSSADVFVAPPRNHAYAKGLTESLTCCLRLAQASG